MPFHGGITDLSNGTLVFSALAAFIYLLVVKWPPSPRRTIIKTLSTTLLALLVVLQAGPATLFAALALGAVGDAFLAHDGKPAFLGGLASFLIAHLIYVWLFWFDGSGTAYIIAETWRLIAALALTGFAGFMFSLLMKTVDVELKAPVTVYVAAILLMGVTALTLDRPVVLLGAAMFIASDAFLATDKFLLSPSSAHRNWMPYAVWGLYYSSQLAIALGFLL